MIFLYILFIILGFLINNTDISTEIVIKEYYARVFKHHNVRNHRPKLPSEFSDISTKIMIQKMIKLGVRNHRPNSPRRPSSPHTSEITVRIHRTPSEITV